MEEIKRKPVSIIHTDNYTYFNLHAEQVFTSNYLVHTQSGIFVTRLESTIFDRIKQHILENKCIKVVVLDFEYLVSSLLNVCDKINELKQHVTIILLNVSKKTFVDKLSNVNNSQNHQYLRINDKNEEYYERYYYFQEDASGITSIEIDTKKILKNEFLKRLQERDINNKFKYVVSHSPFNKESVHPSSSIYLSSYVNLKAFMVSKENKSFIFYALYCLALKIDKEIRNSGIKNKQVVLVCQSLNGSYITSILSTLLKLDVLVFDKIGHVNKLYARPHKIVNNEKAYIIVSDLVCLGTEVKITKSILEFFGAKYLGHVALIKTETLKSTDIERKDVTIAVFSINESNNEELGYEIYTNLKPLKKD